VPAIQATESMMDINVHTFALEIVEYC